MANGDQNTQQAEAAGATIPADQNLDPDQQSTDQADDQQDFSDDFFDDDTGNDDDTAGEAAEPDQGAAAEADDDAPDNSADADDGSEAPGDSGDSGGGDGGEPDKQNPAKKIEQLTYEQANLLKRFERLEAAIGDNPDGKPTAAQAAQMQQIRDDIGELEQELAAIESWEFVKPDTVKKTVALLRQEREARQKIEQRLDRQDRDQYWVNLERQHPHLAGGKGQQLWAGVQQELAEAGFTPGTPEYQGAARILWDRTIAASATQTRAPAPGSPGNPGTVGKGKKPSATPAEPSTKSAKPTEGTSLNPRGASAAAQPGPSQDGGDPDLAFTDDWFNE